MTVNQPQDRDPVQLEGAPFRASSSSKQSPADLQRRRNVLRALGAGLGVVALGGDKLAHGFLCRPVEDGDDTAAICTGTSTQSSSYSRTDSPTSAWTETAPDSCTGTSSETVAYGGLFVYTHTYTLKFLPGPQTVTVSGTSTFGQTPSVTLTYYSSCSGGKRTMSWSSTVTAPLSYSSFSSGSVTYTYDCWWKAEPPVDLERVELGIPAPVEFDVVDQERNVLRTSSRRGRSMMQVSDF